MYRNQEEVGITLEDSSLRWLPPPPPPGPAPRPRPQAPGPALTEAAVDDSEAATESTD